MRQGPVFFPGLGSENSFCFPSFLLSFHPLVRTHINQVDPQLSYSSAWPQAKVDFWWSHMGGGSMNTTF